MTLVRNFGIVKGYSARVYHSSVSVVSISCSRPYQKNKIYLTIEQNTTNIRDADSTVTVAKTENQLQNMLNCIVQKSKECGMDITLRKQRSCTSEKKEVSSSCVSETDCLNKSQNINIGSYDNGRHDNHKRDQNKNRESPRKI